MPIEARLIGGTLMLVLASVFGFLGVFGLLRNYKRRAKGCSAEGTIIGHKQRDRGSGPTIYSPEVEFETPEGEKIVFVASFGSSRTPQRGRKVKVLYYPNDPEDADLSAISGFWIGPSIVILFAAGFLAMAVAFYAGTLPR
jgi:hypothetical protein